jgi:2'-5' RNA ligase
MPEGAERDRLADLIGSLAGRFGTARFAPHVTLLPGVVGPEREVLETTRALAAEIVPFPVELSGLDGTEAHFRCLFLRARPSPDLSDAHARAAGRFGRAPDLSFDPHLSLVYGSLAAPVKAELVRELAAETRTRFEARHLSVWRTVGPVGEWRSLRSFALAGDV